MTQEDKKQALTNEELETAMNIIWRLYVDTAEERPWERNLIFAINDTYYELRRLLYIRKGETKND